MNTETFNEKTHTEGRAILRVAHELRGFLADAPKGEPEAQSLLRDCDTLERVGNWLASSNAVTFSDGHPAADAVDPHAARTGTPPTREATSSSER